MRAFIPSLAAVGIGVASLPWLSSMAGATRPIVDEADKEVVPLSAADAGRTIRLNLRQRVSIQLEANPSTGYGWEVLAAQNVQVDHPIDVVNPSAAPASTVGAPEIAVVKVQPVRSGRGFLMLGYKRPWEKTVEKRIRYRFRIAR